MDSKDKNKKQLNKNNNFLQSLGHAFDGIRDLFLEERNFRSHLASSIFVIIIGLILRLNINQWLWIILAIFLVLLAEIVNTIAENLVDLVVGHHYNSIAKRIKDIAAGGVLITSFLAVIIGMLVFIPVIIQMFLIGGK